MVTCAWCQTKHPSVDEQGRCTKCANAARYPDRPTRKHTLVRRADRNASADMDWIEQGQRHTFPVGEAFSYEE